MTKIPKPKKDEVLERLEKLDKKLDILEKMLDEIYYQLNRI